jgi:hypothetical protein
MPGHLCPSMECALPGHRGGGMRTATVRVRIADMPAMQPFFGAVAALARALAECENLPDPVMSAADEVRRAVAGLGGKDIGPPP